MPIVDVEIRDLSLVRSPGDHLYARGVVLDKDGPTYNVDMQHMPVADEWALTLTLATGAPIAAGLVLRDRTDCLLGVSTLGRPRGALFPYDPNGRAGPTLASFTTGTARLYYSLSPLTLGTFAAYTTPVV